MPSFCLGSVSIFLIAREMGRHGGIIGEHGQCVCVRMCVAPVMCVRRSGSGGLYRVAYYLKSHNMLWLCKQQSGGSSTLPFPSLLFLLWQFMKQDHICSKTATEKHSFNLNWISAGVYTITMPRCCSLYLIRALLHEYFSICTTVRLTGFKGMLSHRISDIYISIVLHSICSILQ